MVQKQKKNPPRCIKVGNEPSSLIYSCLFIRLFTWFCSTDSSWQVTAKLLLLNWAPRSTLEQRKSASGGHRSTFVILRRRNENSMSDMTSEERCHEGSEEDDQQADTVIKVNHKPPPDGGWGWVVCLGAWIVNFLTVGQQNAAGVVYSALLNEYSTKRGETGKVAYTFNRTKSVRILLNTQSRHFVSLFLKTTLR